MVSAISTAGKLLYNIRNIQRQQTTSEEKSIQYQTGQKYQEITKYGKDLSTVLNYRQEIQESNRLLASSQTVLNVLETTEVVLGRFDDLVDTLRNGLEQGLGFDSAADPSSYTDWRDANSNQAEDILREVTDLLNSRVGSRYLFAGSRYNTRPVTQLDTLDSSGDFNVPITTPAGFRPITFDEFNPDRTANEVPDYDVASTANLIPPAAVATPTDPAVITFDANQDSYESSRFHTGDTSVQEFGISSNDPTFTRLIYVARSYKQALTEPDQTLREDYLRQALAELETADVSLGNLRQREAAVLQDIQLLQTREQELVTFRENYLAEIVGVDRETVSVEFSALNQQIQANFTLIASQSRLSLANFIL